MYSFCVHKFCDSFIPKVKVLLTPTRTVTGDMELSIFLLQTRNLTVRATHTKPLDHVGQQSSFPLFSHYHNWYIMRERMMSCWECTPPPPLSPNRARVAASTQGRRRSTTLGLTARASWPEQSVLPGTPSVRPGIAAAGPSAAYVFLIYVFCGSAFLFPRVATHA